MIKIDWDLPPDTSTARVSVMTKEIPCRCEPSCGFRHYSAVTRNKGDRITWKRAKEIVERVAQGESWAERRWVAWVIYDECKRGLL